MTSEEHWTDEQLDEFEAQDKEEVAAADDDEEFQAAEDREEAKAEAERDEFEQLTPEEQSRHFDDEMDLRTPATRRAERTAAKGYLAMDRRNARDEETAFDLKPAGEAKARALKTAAEMLRGQVTDEEEHGIERQTGPGGRGDNVVGETPQMSEDMDPDDKIAEIDEAIEERMRLGEDVGDLADRRGRLVQANATRLANERAASGSFIRDDDGW